MDGLSKVESAPFTVVTTTKTNGKANPMRYPVRTPLTSFPKALIGFLGIINLCAIPSNAQVDVPANLAVRPPTAAQGTGLRGQYWKREPVSILTDGRANRANGIDNQINGFGPATGTFHASRFVYLGNDLTAVMSWLSSDAPTYSGVNSNLDDGAFRFRGYINVPAPGTVRLGLTSDDGSRITIGGLDIAERDGSHGDETQDIDANFAAAGLYPIEVTFFNGDWTSDTATGGLPNHSGNPDPGVHGGANFHLRVNNADITPAQVAMLHSTLPLADVIVNVVETGGDNEATDTITAKWTGQTFPISVANEPVPGAVVGQSYTVGYFGSHSPSFVDRNHRYTNAVPASIPSYLAGGQYIMSGNDNRDNGGYLLDVTISQNADVYLLIDNRLGDTNTANPPTFDATHMQWVVNEGWAPVGTGANRAGNPGLPDEVGIDEGADGTINQYYSIYTKRFPAGTFQLKQADNGGQNMYGAVVVPSGLTTAHVGRNRIGTVTDNGGGSFSIAGGGNDIWDNVDEFTYAYQEVTGDFDVKVRVESLAPNARWSKAGIMVRESLAEDSRMLFPRVTPLDVPTGNGGNGANDNNFAFRTGRDESTAAFGDDHNGGRHEEGGATATYAANQWLRLVRVGSVFTSYSSPDGTTWTPHGGANPQDTAAGDWTISPNNSGPAAATLLVGLGVSRHSAANTAAAEFRSYSLSQGSAAPFAVIGANSRGNPTAVRLEFNHPVGGAAFNAAKYTVDNGVTVSGATAGPVPGTVQLTTSALTEGTTYTVTVATDVTDSSGNVIGPNTIAFVHGRGYELRRIRIAHNQAANDQVDIHLAFNSYTMDLPVVTQSTPAITSNTLFEQDVPQSNPADGREENYAARVSGVLDITTAGGYLFYISSDDNGRLYLSSNDDPAYKVEIAREPAWNGGREYITGGNQVTRGTPPANISQLINLTAGRYYLEVVFSEGGGGNNASAAWQPPGGPAVVNGSLPIPESAFVPSRMFHGNVFYNLGAVSVRRQPVDVTVASPDPATFRVTADGTPDYRYQWQRKGFGEPGFTDISGATTQFYTQATTSPSDDAAEYRVVIRNEFSQVTSATAVLHTTADTTAPTLVSAINVGTSDTQLDVVFSEPVNEADAETLANYAISGGVTLSNPTLQADRRTVRFTTTSLATFTCKTLTVNNVRDASPSGNPIAANSQIGVVYSTKNALVHRFNSITGVNVADLTNNAKFPNLPDVVATVTQLEYPANGGNTFNDYGARVMAFLSPPVTGEYTFYLAADDGAALWLSTDENPANKVQIAREPVWSTSRSWTGAGGGGLGRGAPCTPDGNISCPITLSGGCRYYLEFIFKEGGGGDYGAVAWRTPPSGPAPNEPANGSAPIGANYISAFLLPATLVAEPADVNTICGRIVQFCANIVGTPPLTIQWFKDEGAGGVAIPGANGTCLTIGPVSEADSNVRYYAIADTTSPAGHVETRHALLTVGADTAPPQLLSVSGSSNFYTINLVFDEVLDAESAVDTFSYAVSGLTVTQAVVSADGMRVTLFHEPQQTVNTVYEVTVAATTGALLDFCKNPMPETKRTFRSWVDVCGGLSDPTGVSINIIQQPASQTACLDPRSATQPPAVFSVQATAERDTGGAGTLLKAENFNTTDGGFTVETPIAYDGPWVWDSATGSWKQEGQAPENSHANTSLLSSPAATITTPGPVQLSFVHRYSFEGGFWDGGQVRISVNGGPFTAVPNSAFTQNGYNGAVLPNSASLLAGQPAFVENSPNRASGQFITSVASLGNFTAGTTIRIQFMAASDTNTRGQFQPNWEIDSLRCFQGGAGPVALPLSIQWQRSVGGGAFADILGATAGTLTFAPTLSANGYRYRAVLCTQGATETTSEATLTVIQANTAPSFVCGPNQTVLEGAGPQSVAFASNIQPDSLPEQTSGSFSNGFAGDTVIVPTPLTTTFESPFPGTRSLDPSGAAARPDPRIDAGILKLTDAGDAGGFGGFAFGPYDPQTVQSLNISWKSRIGGGGGGGADGYSLNIGSDLADDFQGEEGTGTGLTVAVDTFDNADVEIPDVGIEINWGGAASANRLAFLAIPKDNPGDGNFLRKDTFVNASLSVTPAGVATLIYDGNTVSATLPSYTGITFNQINFGARTGGANDNQWIDDFTTDIIVNVPQLLPAPVGTALYGSTYIRDGALHLTDAVNGQQGSFVVSNLLGNAALGSFTITFDALLGLGTTPPADGFSVSVANDLPAASWGEEGAGTGLIVAFDSFDNGGGEAPAIDVYWNGLVIAHTLVPTGLETGGQFVPVSIRLDPDGTLDVVAAGNPVYTDLPTGFVPIAGARFGLGGRTGGLNERNWIDNLSISALSANYAAAEAGQTVQFTVSNNNPSLFSAQPAIAANGTLTYTSAADACGSATVTAVARDNGGTACNGSDTSGPCTFTINVTCVNACPVANPASVTVAAGGSVNFQLPGTDADGDPLTYAVAQAAAHGTVTVNLNTGAATYTPSAGYTGPDSFTYTVNDGQCTSPAGLVSITVGVVNRPPVCAANAGPEACILRFPNDANLYVVSLDNSQSCVVLDGSGSSDPDGDPLSYNWTVDGFSVSLDAAQEPGGTGGTGSGSGKVTLSGNTLTIAITFSGLSANATAAHIHGPAGLGTNAAVLYPLTVAAATAGTISQTVTLVEGTGGFTIAQQLQQLCAGLWYINIHTPLHQGGEIRGQLQPGALNGAIVTACLDLGCHSITLCVSDGRAASSCNLSVCVISAGEAVEECVTLVENTDLGRKNKRPLIASLKAATAAFDRGNFTAGLNILEAFQNKVGAQIARDNPAAATALIECAQRIIDAVGCAAEMNGQ